MKTRLTPFCTIVLITLLFSSCQKDALIDPITPSFTIDESSDLRSSDNTEFELWQQVNILQPDCGNDPIMTKDTEGNDDEILKTSGCFGLYGLTSYEGGGWALNYGRFTSIVDLKFDADKNVVSGTIELNFSGVGDMLVLKASGSISSEVSSEDGKTLTVDVTSHKGTGRFAHVSFTGTLYIMEADKIFDGDATDYYATLYIKGEFGR
jgi:hypothetical protein